MFLDKQGCGYICTRRLISYTNHDVLSSHIQKSGQKEITSIGLSKESHLCWKDHFHKNPLYFRIIAEFKADNENDNSTLGNKTFNI